MAICQTSGLHKNYPRSILAYIDEVFPMQANTHFKERSLGEAELAFEQNLRYKLHQFLQNECVMTPQGIERVMDSLREVYITGVHAIAIEFTMQIPPDSKYAPFTNVIQGYCSEHSQAMGSVMINAFSSVAYNLLCATARLLARQDDREHKRRAN
jgi:hypothetical protein